MKTLAVIVLCLMVLATLTACADPYYYLTYPETRFNPGDQ